MQRHIASWFWAARPFSLPASVVPVVVGTALAVRDGAFHSLHFLLTLVGGMLVQIATNLVDEYADHSRSGSLGKLLAPYKVIALGALSARAVRAGALLSFGLAIVIGLYLVAATGWPLLLACVASLVVAYGYSGGPRPLGDLGLGEPLVFVFMGLLMVMASYYVQTLSLTWEALVASLPVACLVTAILVVNDLRDIDEDRAGGKITPVSRFGRRFGVVLFIALMAVAYLSVLLWIIARPSMVPLLLVLAALPRGIATIRRMGGGADRTALNQALRGAAQLHLQFGALLALGLVLVRFI